MNNSVMGSNSVLLLFGMFSLTFGHTVLFTKPHLNSQPQSAFKVIQDVPWDIECARQCKREPDCLYMAFNVSGKECHLFDSNNCDNESLCTGSGDFQLYQMHEDLVCEHGIKISDDKCNCTDSYVGRRCDRIMQDCSEGAESGFYDGQHGTFWIKPKLSSTPFQVHCYMKYGKTFLQKNSIWDPFKSFDKTWQDYVDGFGDLSSSHWLGLQHVNEITNSRTYNLRINIHATPLWNNKTIIYHNFKITDAASGFQLTTGVADPVDPWPLDDCLSKLNNTAFNTPDSTDLDCTVVAQSGWWFDNNCGNCNLNGNVDTDRTEQGAFWNDGFQSDKIIYTEMTLVAA